MAVSLTDLKTEVDLFIQHLREQSNLPDGYPLTVEMSPDSLVRIGRRRKKFAGSCYASADSARVYLAGKRALHAVLLTAAHEFGHVLQAVNGCTLKKHGKARERQVDEFADRVTLPYLKMRATSAPDHLRGSYEVGVLLGNLALPQAT